jgi:outer membrane protein assembly complex protein YaeT
VRARRAAIGIAIGTAIGVSAVALSAQRVAAQTPAPAPVGRSETPAPPAANGDRVVRQLKFEGNHALDAQTLAASISTTNSSFFATNPVFKWIGLGEKRYFDETDFQRDVLRLEVLYKRSGFPDVQVDTTVRRDPENVYVTFRIQEGKPIRVQSLTWSGLDSLRADARKNLLVDLPIAVGDPFNRFALQTAIDTVTQRLRNRGYPGAEIFRQFTSNERERTATIALDVVPGPRAHIAAIRVEGSTRVDSSVARKLLVTRPHRAYREDELLESQRNLYGSDLYALASVSIDSAHYEPGSDSVPLLVRVTDAPPYRARAGVGYGTNDCFRTQAGLTQRNFLGAGQVFDLNTRVSKIGVGRPLDAGLENSLCPVLNQDTVGSFQLNYNVTASLRRPAFLSSRNTLSASVYAERRSEFKVYLRSELGAQLTFTRETPRRRLPISVAYTLAYGRTTATPAVFCAFFSSCDPADIAFLQERRRLATLGFNITAPRANSPIDPTRGFVTSFDAVTSSRYLLSSPQQEFTRLTADGAWYRTLARDVVLSWHLRGGILFAPAIRPGPNGSFVPLEQRYYAGGPNDVRGYQRNELGPVVYVVADTALFDTEVHGDPTLLQSKQVRVAATGGNTLLIGQVELRMPAPIFSSRLRLAAFADAGSLWERGAAGSRAAIRVTPGIGLRVATPLGPARLDVAYNPYKLLSGPLFVTDSTGQLTPVPGASNFVLDRTSNFTFHFSVGQPF